MSGVRIEQAYERRRSPLRQRSAPIIHSRRRRAGWFGSAAAARRSSSIGGGGAYKYSAASAFGGVRRRSVAISNIVAILQSWENAIRIIKKASLI